MSTCLNSYHDLLSSVLINKLIQALTLIKQMCYFLFSVDNFITIFVFSSNSLNYNQHNDKYKTSAKHIFFCVQDVDFMKHQVKPSYYAISSREVLQKLKEFLSSLHKIVVELLNWLNGLCCCCFHLATKK
jgi:hypothetical protein